MPLFVVALSQVWWQRSTTSDNAPLSARSRSSHLCTRCCAWCWGAAPVAVVVGAACRFPGEVRSLTSLWRLPMARRDAVRQIPDESWKQAEPAGLPYQVAARLRYGCFLDDDVYAYEPEFCGINTRGRLGAILSTGCCPKWCGGHRARRNSDPAAFGYSDGHALRDLPEGLHAAGAPPS
ncbi:hypothetical protein CJD44_17635 [Streptomyces sp. alain-838]|nr:hypothetical protein CJD44_17635 [Streptomyces sp. alain-838]